MVKSAIYFAFCWCYNSDNIKSIWNKEIGMMKKLTVFLMAVVMLFGFAMTGCAGGGKKGNTTVVNDEKTINVKVYKGGFGDEWIYELQNKFESVYSEQGYKVNILAPSGDLEGDIVLQEMARGYDTTKIDLYITGAILTDSVGENGDYGVLCEDLEETVFNKPAIGYDGVEESETVRAKFPSELESCLRDSNGIMYAFNWAQSAAGVVVNTKKLSEYGLDIPRTTNEMFDVFDKIYTGYNGIPGKKPITYTPSARYADSFIAVLLAQYDFEERNKFLSMEDAGRRMLKDGYEVFNIEGIVPMLTVAHRVFDNKIAAKGSMTQNLMQAQGKIMGNYNDDAIFMFNGDWMLNEVKANYRNNLNDIDFVNFPVISDIGVRLFGADTSYGMTSEECDSLLSYIIGLVDENKSIEEIVSAVKSERDISLAASDAEAVASARGIYTARGIEHLAFVTKGTDKLDIVSLFLRMMASEDFAETFATYANGSSPYATKAISLPFGSRMRSRILGSLL